MPTNKKPRKKHRPRTLYNPIELAMQNTQPVTEYDPSYILKLKLRNHSAMDNLVKGRADKKDINCLIALHNIMEAWYQMGICKPLSDEILAGKRAVMEICFRAVTKSKFIATGPEISALNTLMELHDEMLPGLTSKDFDEGILLAKKIIAKREATILPEVEEIT